MRIVCIDRLAASRPITALVYRLARVLRSNDSRGNIIAEGCLRLLRQLSYEFASHTLSEIVGRNEPEKPWH